MFPVPITCHNWAFNCAPHLLSKPCPPTIEKHVHFFRKKYLTIIYYDEKLGKNETIK
jgi:hypothetical protein